MVFDTFIESLMTGRVIFMVLFGLITGYLIGWMRLGPIGVIIITAIILFIQMGLFVTGEYIQTLAWIGNTGSAGFKVGDVFLIHFFLHPCILASAVAFGWYARGIQDGKVQKQAEALTVGDFEKALRVLGSHPDLAGAGWFDQRWAKMEKKARLEWITQNADQLRALWLEANGEGLQAHGRELPMRLAEIDTDQSIP